MSPLLRGLILWLAVCSSCLRITVGGSERSALLQEWLLLCNGNLDNAVQVQSGIPDHIQARLVPVYVPSLGERPQVLLDYAVNGTSVILQVAAFYELQNAIYVDFYNFTDAFQYKYGEYDIENLASLDASSFSTDASCTARYVRLQPEEYEGVWPDCTTSYNGRHPEFVVNFARDFVTMTIPVGASEVLKYSPYVFQRYGPSYPLIDN